MSEIYCSNSFKMNLHFLYTVEEHLTFTVSVFSDGFFGTCSFCLSKDHIRSVIDTLKCMEAHNEGEVRICDLDSDSYFFLRKQDQRIHVNGQIGASHSDNYMVFKHTTDPTIAYLLRNALSQWND